MGWLKCQTQKTPSRSSANRLRWDVDVNPVVYNAGQAESE